MMNRTRQSLSSRCKRAALPLLVWSVLTPAAAGAHEAAAVLSKGSGLYFETFMAFQKALGRPITSFDLSRYKPRLESGLKAVVTFGAAAAAFEYPPKTRIISLLAPGYRPKIEGGRFTKVSTLPEPAQAITAYKELQPGLKRLAVLFNKNSAGNYASILAEAARPYGVEILPVGLGGPLEFPDKLRELEGKADAFWLLPEPALINKTSLMVLAEFSCSNKIPFYAPSGGLSELGAAASFAPTFAEAAATAASALEKALAGKPLPDTIYVARSELTVNAAFVAKCGLAMKLPAAGGAR